MIPASLSLTVTWAGCAKTADRIDVLFWVETPGDPGNVVLDGVSLPYGEEEGVQYGLCQITLVACSLEGNSIRPTPSVTVYVYIGT